MRIALVGQPHDPIDAVRGPTASVAAVTREIARRLAHRHEVTIYAPLAKGQPVEEITDGGVRIRRQRLPFRDAHRFAEVAHELFPSLHPYLASTRYCRGYMRLVARDLREHPVDVVHVHTLAQFLPMLRGAAPGARLVLHVHNPVLAGFASPRLRKAIAAADAIVTCSDYVTARLRAVFDPVAPTIGTIGNGVDLDRFRPLPAPRPSGAPRLLFVGRVAPDKGVHILAEAFGRLCSRYPDLVLDIVGRAGLLPLGYLRADGDAEAVEMLAPYYGRTFRERWSRQLRAPGPGYRRAIVAGLTPECASRARFHDARPQAELAQLYAAATVTIVPSIVREPFGMPLVEAMACGRPVIASDVGGISGIVDDGTTGLLVPRGDSGALAAAIADLLDDPARREAMGRRARRCAERRFGWDLVVERLVSVYSSPVSASS